MGKSAEKFLKFLNFYFMTCQKSEVPRSLLTSENESKSTAT